MFDLKNQKTAFKIQNWKQPTTVAYIDLKQALNYFKWGYNFTNVNKMIWYFI